MSGRNKEGASAAFGPVLRSIWNKAQQTQSGIMLKAGTQNEAINLRQRLYKLRTAEDVKAKKLGNEFHGPWQDLRIVIKDDERDPAVKWLWITRDNILIGDLEVRDLATGKQLTVDPLVDDPATAVRREQSEGNPFLPKGNDPFERAIEEDDGKFVGVETDRQFATRMWQIAHDGMPSGVLTAEDGMRLRDMVKYPEDQPLITERIIEYLTGWFQGPMGTGALPPTSKSPN